jgi:hypothetical protein
MRGNLSRRRAGPAYAVAAAFLPISTLTAHAALLRWLWSPGGAMPRDLVRGDAEPGTPGAPKARGAAVASR